MWKDKAGVRAAADIILRLRFITVLKLVITRIVTTNIMHN